MVGKHKPQAKPARAFGAGTIEQRIWTAIRARSAAGLRITLPDAAFDAKAKEGTAGYYFERLVAGGYLKLDGRQPRNKTSRGQFSYAAYRLERDVGMAAPRLRRDGTPATWGLAREQMWRTAKILLSFDARDLSLAASTPERAVRMDDAKQYLCALRRGGYVVASPARRSASTLTRFRFVQAKNTGPLAPAVRADRSVYDRNLGEYAWQPASK